MLLTALDSLLTEREKDVLKNRLGFADITFSENDLKSSVSAIYQKYNLSLVPVDVICEKYHISEARLKQIEGKFMHKSGLNQRERLNRLKEFLNDI